MPTPAPALASPRKPIHLLRALLRESSYLPDATARLYFRRYVVSRFKAYHPRENATASVRVQAVERYRHQGFKRRQLAIIHERTRPLLRKGQKALNFLRRANQGEIPCLQKVLFFAYGRMGKRKYALLDNLLRPDPIMDNSAPPPDMGYPTPLQALYYSNERCLQFFDAPKPSSSKTHYTIEISNRYSRLRAVVRSQHQKGLGLHKEIKSPYLKTPINNIWERPMPINRARNNVRRWYAKTLTKLLPPLPSDEWDNIHAMMVGEKRISLVKRRERGLDASLEAATEDERFASAVEAAIALDKPSRADKPAGMQRPHAVTPKFMRKLYTSILVLCCKLEYDEQHKAWKAVWGERLKHIKTSLYTVPTDESLFAGVDSKGRLLQTAKEHDVDRSSRVQPRNAEGEYVRFPFFTDYLPADHPLQKELHDWKRKRAAVAQAEKRKVPGGAAPP
ncbi:hypothetical protein BDW02DRAFT_493580 [Decorospora gaudefroyi]|uniref:LYR motif-containing protein Cup1-like N-terminal domain-containing protein n=1 Tax=Decorospora gaudefroyi TaxID=184978 RepID=A0A6A5KE60_9PLEO|nr:hypothetical protein BDW02DRAFT_493580 [Decorospora gaudefroyi]